MALPQDHISMALFCDFENVALGVREANYDKFDIKKVLEKLLLKGSIVVKKAYCDWERYRGFKAAMHEANFELIEIPHVRQSGKNSADIRMVVDALDLCYTKSHVNTFVIISGDSDFSPLVSKLRENAKFVIGVGVKQSTSDLLIANCDEFIFYDDLVRGSRRDGRDARGDAQPQPRRSPEEERRRREELDARRTKGVEMAFETYEALVTDRDDGGKIWASVLKEALKRRNPGFNESYYGFKTFGNLLEEAQSRGLLVFGRDDKSGAYVSRGSGVASSRPAEPDAPSIDTALEPAPGSDAMDAHADLHGELALAAEAADAAPAASERPARSGSRGDRGDRSERGERGEGGRRRGRGGRRGEGGHADAPDAAERQEPPVRAEAQTEARSERQNDAPPPAPERQPEDATAAEAGGQRAPSPAGKSAAASSRGRRPRKAPAGDVAPPAASEAVAAPAAKPGPADEAPAAPAAKAARKAAPRRRSPRASEA